MQQSVEKSKTIRGRTSYESGQAAEDRISMDYKRRGFPIIQRRWRGQSGEIDLIARDGDGLVFIEVKQSRTFDRALSHLTERQISRLYRAAEEFSSQEPNSNLTDVRFDVALVNGRGEYRIIENAFA